MITRPAAGVRFDRFCSTILRQSKGRWAGLPLELEPWQARITDEILRTDERGVRVHREALVGLPRKNGKSTLSAALALYLLVADGEPGAEVYSAAASKDQARIVFDQAREMVLASPYLLQRCDVGRDRITLRGPGGSTAGVYRVIAADAPRQYGLNPSAVVVDELWAHEDDGELYYALRTAMGAREQPLMVSITTAGYDLETICGQLYDRGRRGEPGFYHCWLEVGGEQLDDRDAWKAANPASWITVEWLEGEAKILPRFVFERLHLNRWTASEEAWLPAGAWEGCASGSELYEGDEVYVGVDLGLKHDTAAVVYGRLDPGGLFTARAQVWGLWPDPRKPQPPAHTIIRDERLPLKHVEEFVREIAETFEVVECGYDPYRFEPIAQRLGDEGLWMTEFRQTDTLMVPASSGLYQAILERQIAHDADDHVLAAHVGNAAAEQTRSGWRLAKKKSKRPMDAAVALAIAHSRALADAGITDEQEGDPEAAPTRVSFETLA